MLILGLEAISLCQAMPYRCPQSTPQSPDPRLANIGSPYASSTPGNSPRDWDALCTSTGDMAATIASARDRGVPSSALAALTAQLLPSRTYQVISLLVTPLLRDIYGNPGITPSNARQQAERVCVEYGRTHQLSP
jgi:hypothetical protein